MGEATGADDRGGAPLFNPSAGIRALADVQRRGLIAAGELVDRLIGAVDGDRTPSASGRATRPTPDDDPQTLDLVTVWIDVFQRGLQAMIPGTRNHGPAAVNGAQIATADLARGTTTGAVHIRAAAHSGSPGNGDGGASRGGRRGGTAEVWLHNATPEPVPDLRLHAGDLRAHDTRTLPKSALRFDPPSLDELPARSSRGVVVVADVAERVPGGVYRGVLLVTGAPDVWLPIVVTVAEQE